MYRQLVKTSPNVFRDQLSFIRVAMRHHGQYKARQELKSLLGDGPVWQCHEAASIGAVSKLRQLRRNPLSRECAAYHLVGFTKEPDDIAILVKRFEQNRLAGSEASKLASALAQAGKLREAERVARSAIARDPPEEFRIALTLALADYLRTQGKRAEAARLDEQLELEVVRSRVPAALYWYAASRSHVVSAQKGDAMLQKAAEIAVQHGAYGACSVSLGKLVGAAVDRGDMVSAIRWGPRAVACADKSTSDDDRAAARIGYGRALVKSGQANRAVPVLQSAVGFATRARHDYLIADSEHNLAHAFESTWQWAEARRAADRFVSAAIRSTNPSQGVVSLRDAGIIYWDSGERAAASKYFARMVRLIDRTRQDSYWAGEFYERIGDLARARAYYRRSLTEGGEEARKTAGLTRIYLAVGAVDSALLMAARHDAALLTPEEVLLVPFVRAVQGQYAEALRESGQWAVTQERRNNVRGTVNAYLQVAEIAAVARRFTESAVAARRAYAFAVIGNVESDQSRALVHLGTAQSATRDKGAIATLNQAVTQAQRSGQPILMSEAWSALGDVLARDQRGNAALSAFDSALAAHRRIDDTFVEDFDRARYRLASAEWLDRASWMAARSGNAALVFEWQVRRKVFRKPGQSLTQVMRSLRASEAVIDYLVSDTGVAALVLRRDTAVLIDLPVSRARIRLLVNRLRQPVATSFGRLDRIRARFDHVAANELATLLITPLRPLLGSTDTWYVSPDDALHLVPFDTFLEDREGRRRFLIESTTISYIAAADAQRAGGSISLDKVTVLSSATPGLAAETKAIRASVPHVTVLDEPTERTVGRAATIATVLHFAAHAEANEEQPLSSYLRVAAGDRDDGYFHVNEIAQSDVRARLVVLSACETRVGRVFAQGPLSLTNAFMRAGARDVIATEWAIGPAAAEFSRGLYEQLRSGKTVQAAVRNAKLQMRNNPDTNNPLIWGAFVLMTGR